VDQYCWRCDRYTQETVQGECSACDGVYDFLQVCDHCGDTGIILTDDMVVETFQGEEFVLEGQMISCSCAIGLDMKEFLD
jgi:hypothetical protein